MALYRLLGLLFLDLYWTTIVTGKKTQLCITTLSPVSKYSTRTLSLTLVQFVALLSC